MHTRYLKDFRRSILLLIGQIALLALSIFFIFYFYENYIAPDKAVAEDFVITQCRVVDKGVAQSGGAYRRYRAQFRLSYSTRMGEIEGVASANGIDFSYSTDEASQQAYLDEFEIGSVYPCWYNPQNTTQVVLVLRHSWYSTLPLAFPAIIALISFFYMIKTIIDLIETRLIIEKKKEKTKSRN
jgi:hypothetical protein